MDNFFAVKYDESSIDIEGARLAGGGDGVNMSARSGISFE